MNSPAFDEQLFETYSLALLRYFRGRLKGPTSFEDAKDLTQETLKSIFINRESFARRAHLSTWVFTIAENELRRHLRRQQALKRSAEVVSIDFAGEAGELDTDGPREPGKVLQSREFFRALRRFMDDGLTHRQQEILDLRIWGLTYPEIAEEVGLKIDSVKSHLFNARRRVREFLDRRETGRD